MRWLLWLVTAAAIVTIACRVPMTRHLKWELYAVAMCCYMAAAITVYQENE
jgi:hypothetical protein